MDVRSMKSALDLVIEELHATDQEFEGLRVKKTRLEAVMTNLQALLKDSDQLAGDVILIKGSPIPTAVEPRGIDLRPSWMVIRDVFPKSGGSLTVPQIHKLVNAEGTKISNPDAIRIAMRRHPEVFVNNGGLFSLRSDAGGLSFNAKEATEVAS
jgi:hypothetical protein